MAYDTTSTFVDDELWLLTSPHPSGPPYLSGNWRPEWLEYGVTNGIINRVYYTTTFFWARQYWSPAYGAYLYNEYLASGTASLNTPYAVQIRWQGAGYWQILRNGASQYTGIQSQQPPGSYQALEAGAEMTTTLDEEYGKVSGLANVQGGTPHTNWTGYVFVAPTVFTIDQSSDHLTFHTVRTCP